MLEERTTVDEVTYRSTGHIEVRELVVILSDGEEISGTNHRHVINPGDDVTGEDPKVQEAAANWTPELIATWQAERDALFNKPTTADDVNQERTRRIVAGKTIDGIHVTGRDEDARNLTNLALAAQLRVASGDTATLTTFRDGDNVDHQLTPPQMLAVWQAASSYVSDLYSASWAIKAMDPLPEDVTSDHLWPAA
jgi:hypothetical protein